MKKYMVIANQDGGCDYTIGCGVSYSIIEAEDREDALNKVVGAEEHFKTEEYDGELYRSDESCIALSYNYQGEDYSADRLTIYELGDDVIANDEILAKWRESEELLEQMNAALAESEIEAEEKAEYERLKSKFEDA
jgi:hypothetical protein